MPWKHPGTKTLRAHVQEWLAARTPEKVSDFIPLAPISLLCFIIGLRRVNPAATPPIGRKKQSIAGIVINTVSLVGWSFIWAINSFSPFWHAP